MLHLIALTSIWILSDSSTTSSPGTSPNECSHWSNLYPNMMRCYSSNNCYDGYSCNRLGFDPHSGADCSYCEPDYTSTDAPRNTDRDSSTSTYYPDQCQVYFGYDACDDSNNYDCPDGYSCETHYWLNANTPCKYCDPVYTTDAPRSTDRDSSTSTYTPDQCQAYPGYDTCDASNGYDCPDGYECNAHYFLDPFTPCKYCDPVYTSTDTPRNTDRDSSTSTYTPDHCQTYFGYDACDASNNYQCPDGYSCETHYFLDPFTPCKYCDPVYTSTDAPRSTDRDSSTSTYSPDQCQVYFGYDACDASNNYQCPDGYECEVHYFIDPFTPCKYCDPVMTTSSPRSTDTPRSSTSTSAPDTCNVYFGYNSCGDFNNYYCRDGYYCNAHYTLNNGEECKYCDPIYTSTDSPRSTSTAEECHYYFGYHKCGDFNNYYCRDGYYCNNHYTLTNGEECNYCDPDSSSTYSPHTSSTNEECQYYFGYDKCGDFNNYYCQDGYYCNYHYTANNGDDCKYCDPYSTQTPRTSDQGECSYWVNMYYWKLSCSGDDECRNTGYGDTCITYGYDPDTRAECGFCGDDSSSSTDSPRSTSTVTEYCYDYPGYEKCDDDICQSGTCTPHYTLDNGIECKYCDPDSCNVYPYCDEETDCKDDEYCAYIDGNSDYCGYCMSTSSTTTPRTTLSNSLNKVNSAITWK